MTRYKGCLLSFLFLAQLGCGQSALPPGEAYEAVTGDRRVVVLGESTVDVVDGARSSHGEYRLQEDGRARVVMAGTGMVEYFDLTDDGLREVDTDGRANDTLYDRAHLGAAREDYYCGLVEEDVRSLGESQETRRSERGRYVVTGSSAERLRPLGNGVARKVTGVDRAYFATLTTHAECGRAFLFHSSRAEWQTFLDLDESQRRWDQLIKEVETDRVEEPQRQKHEAESLALRTADSRRPGRTIGRFTDCFAFEELEPISVTVMDVGYRVKWDNGSREETHWFGHVRSIDEDEEYAMDLDLWPTVRVMDRIQRAGHLAPLVVFESSSRRDEFYELLTTAWKDWKKEYPEVWQAAGH